MADHLNLPPARNVPIAPAESTLTPDEIAMIDATVARHHAERADAPTMAAKYDDACERIVELLDETARQRRRIQALEDQLRDRDARIAEVEAEREAAHPARPTPADAGLRDRIAQVLYPVVHPTKWADHIARWIADDLMPVITAELDARWEQGRLHGLRQAHRPGDARARQLEADIQMMLTIEEGNSKAWELKCARVRELEAENQRLQALADRRWVAWHSARQRAEAYGEAILRHVEERNWALGWLKAAETRVAELDTALDTARAQLAATTNPARAADRLAADAHPGTITE